MRTIKLLVATGWALTPVATSAIGCQVIPMDVSGPRPTVSVRMNGRPPVQAIFDTGAMSMTVDSNQEPALGLVNAGPLKPPFNEHGTGFQTSLKNVRIGNLVIGDVDVAAMPSMMPGVAGVVSPSTFGNRYVTVDMAGSRLRICPKTAANHPAGKGEPYTPEPVSLPAVPLVAGNERLAAHIDSGSPLGVSFPMRYSTMFKFAEPLKNIGIARSHFGEKPIYRAKIDGPVQVGALTLDSPQVYFSDVVPGPNVGGDLLKRLTITIDPVSKLVWTAVVEPTQMLHHHL